MFILVAWHEMKTIQGYISVKKEIIIKYASPIGSNLSWTEVAVQWWILLPDFLMSTGLYFKL